MRAIKVAALGVLLIVAVVIAYQLLRFGKEASDLVLATLRSAERTAAHNEEIAASLAAAKEGERIAQLQSSLESVLKETTLTMQALRPAIVELTATTRAARTAIEETSATAKAARTAIEGAKLPDTAPLLNETTALVGETTRLVRDVNASAPQALARSERLLNRLDTLITDSDLTSTLRTTGRIAANIERDQANVSAIIANGVPVSDAVRKGTEDVEHKVGLVRRFFKALAKLF
jgi:hypothetical protein